MFRFISLYPTRERASAQGAAGNAAGTAWCLVG